MPYPAGHQIRQQLVHTLNSILQHILDPQGSSPSSRKLTNEAAPRNSDAIDQADEKRLLRKLDMRILPLLGICYFFYVSFPLMLTVFDDDRGD